MAAGSAVISGEDACQYWVQVGSALKDSWVVCGAHSSSGCSHAPRQPCRASACSSESAGASSAASESEHRSNPCCSVSCVRAAPAGSRWPSRPCSGPPMPRNEDATLTSAATSAGRPVVLVVAPYVRVHPMDASK